MQGSSVEPSEYATLGDTLGLADGWQFRIRTLDEDLTVSLDGKVKVVMDDFKNVYNLPVKARGGEEPVEGADKPLEVVIAVYPGPDSAGKDFDPFLALVEAGTVRSEGALLVTRDVAGNVQTQEGDGARRRGLKRFVAGRLTKGIAEAMDEKLPPGAAGIVAVYDHPHAGDVDRAMTNAMAKSVGHIDKASPKDLKAGLEQAQARLVGG